MIGWIKIHRKILDHWIYKSNEPFTKREAFIDILLNVNFEAKKVNIGNTLIDCNPGQSLNSLDTWGKRWKWNKSKVRRFLKLLENDSIIVTESVHKSTRLTVCNWDSYQGLRNADETQMKRKRNADETQTTPTKEGKESKEGNKVRSIGAKNFSPPTIEEVRDYCFERKNNVDPEKFIDFYSSKGWMVGKNKMKDWKASVRTWEKEKQKKETFKGRFNTSIQPRTFDELSDGL